MNHTPTLRRLLLGCAALALLLAICVFLLGQAQQRFDESAYPLKYADTVLTAAEEYGLPPSLIYAVIHTESSFNPSAQSSADAVGLMQITNDTYRWALQRAGAEDTYDPDTLLDPVANIQCGTYILHLLGEKFENTQTVLAAYNAGQGHVRQWLADPAYSEDGVTLSHIPFAETEEYIRRVLTAQQRYQQIYNIL